MRDHIVCPYLLMFGGMAHIGTQNPVLRTAVLMFFSLVARFAALFF